ncbi:MAG: ATP-binding protein [Mariprofundaceae bacterium]|nr:ATP-binding protein [Mariprofundaceae bacterium]
MLNTYNHAQSYYFFADVKARIVHTSEALRKLSGYDYAALEGSLLDKLFQFGDVAEDEHAADFCASIMAKKSLKKQQVLILHKHQSSSHAMLNINPVYDDQAKLCGYEGHVQPSLKQPLQGKQQHAIIRLDQDGTVIYANAGSQQLLADLGGKLGTRLAATWHHRISKAYQQGHTLSLNIPTEHQNYRCQCIPQHDEILIAASPQQPQQPKRRSPENTQQVNHLHMRGIAHDLNNSLGIIMGNVSLMGKFPDDQAAMAVRVQRIHKATQTAAALCHDLITPNTTQHKPIQPTSTTALFSHITSMLDGVVEKNPVALQVQEPTQNFTFYANQQQVQRVLMNLIINAKQSMSGLEGQVSISADKMEVEHRYLQQCYGYPAAKTGLYVYIEVADRGCGMDEHTKQHLFEPFYSTKSQGHGLGMSTVFNIVQAYQGLIHVDSQTGQGSRIRILFPMLDAQPQHTEVNTLLNNIAKRQQHSESHV